MPQPQIILIAGPTASGKSALALDIARKRQGVIINADAMQIYAGLPVLTAQPGAEEQKEIPHELYGVMDPSERSSAGKWLALAKSTIEKTIAAGRVPVLVGGTGLYFKALLGGLADIPDVPEDVRKKVEQLYEDWGEERFRGALEKLDPESATRLARNDRQRLIRAYEVAEYTGKPIGYWQGQSTQNILQDFEIESHICMPEREKLYTACDRRFEIMMANGAVEEVRQLLSRNLDPDLPAMKILGVREIAAYLKGDVTREQAIEKARQATRNYAKRQMTWFRHQWPFKN